LLAAQKVVLRPSEVVELFVVDNPEEDKEDKEIMDVNYSQQVLPKTGNFGRYHGRNEPDESDGGKTVWRETSLQIFWPMTSLIPLRGLLEAWHSSCTFHMAIEKMN
jgi:hypothetical protein